MQPTQLDVEGSRRNGHCERRQLGKLSSAKANYVRSADFFTWIHFVTDVVSTHLSHEYVVPH